MAYHTLTNETGGTADDRRAEADRILELIGMGGIDDDQFTQSERKFVDDMRNNPNISISPKQLFWLRDIKDKYL